MKVLNTNNKSKLLTKSKLLGAALFAILFIASPANIYCNEDEQKLNSLEQEGMFIEEMNEDSEYQENESSKEDLPYSRARVVRIIDEISKETEYSGGVIKSNIQKLEVFVYKGPHKGEKVIIEYELNYDLVGNYKSIPLSKGDEILLYVEENQKGEIENAFVVDFARDKYLAYLVIGFLILMLLVGRKKGVKAIISLVLTIFAVVKILLPAILNGWDPVIVSSAICIVVICITLIIISGFNKKTLCAAVGTCGGVTAAGAIALIIGNLAKLTGLGNEESQMLMYILGKVQLDFRGLLFGGIIIGTMGATMDVGMSIASAMHEIKANSPKIKTYHLLKAGMNVGRDIMATMANTLILAYAGGSLHLMLLFAAHKTPFSNIINWDMIASEVLRAIAGSTGILFAIPITALASAFIQRNHDQMQQI